MTSGSEGEEDVRWLDSGLQEAMDNLIECCENLKTKTRDMDKASIIKDAIDYLQELHEQERRIQADLIQLESGKLKKNAVFDLDQEIPTLSRLKKKGIDHSYDSRRSTTSSIEDLEVSL
ncbi:hypothetical protein TEA_021094 [Camellia sinensis var. sinensis]|uniref:BHLH domain-containing protein n=1 Tax=Camellia sinensis var. sinensis TaxID=542762 RepID=A0A4S4DBH6_CAMSN|nr:hypothetical protein TEA_021094 [Camellia sinensis var. sinensis]